MKQEKTFFITYKRKGKGFAEVDRMIKAINRKQAIEKLENELGFNVTIKDVSTL